MARSDPRSPLAMGMVWVSRITSIGLSFVLPAVGGAFVDGWLKCSPIGALVGVVLGFAVGTLQLMRIAKTQSPR